jgi:fluoride exporter
MAMWMAVLFGGALGSVARHGMNVAASRLLGAPGPWPTAAVNMLGSLVIGVLAGALAAERLSMSAPLRAFVFVGILGGFTTFSSFMLDSFVLIDAGHAAKAVFNLVGQLLLGMLLTYVGYHLGLRA